MKYILFLLFPFLLSAQQIPTSAFSLQTTRGLSTAEQSFDNNPGSSFFQGWSLQSGEFVLSFDGQYEINKIRWLDGSGQPKLILYADNSTTPLTTIFLHQYLVWGEEKVSAKVNSIRFVLDGLQGNNSIPEIVLFGKKVRDTPQDTVIVPVPPTTTGLTGVGARVNLNGFHWVPFDLLKGVFTKKRDFQSSSWTWAPEGFSPQPLAGAISPGVMGYDDYLTAAKKAGIDIIPAVNQTPAWFLNKQNQPQMSFVSDYDGESVPYYTPKQGIVDSLGGNINMPPSMAVDGYDPDSPPMKPGADPLDPASYIEYARFMFQYAARYGTTVWPDNMLKVSDVPAYNNAPVNEKKSGLGLLKYIEPWNEADKWWRQSIYWQPEAFAAFLSACYDGHGGTLGRGVGIYGCGIKLLMPGITAPDLSYYKRMVSWCRLNRPDKTLAWDVANIHYYTNVGSQAGRHPPTWTAGTPADVDKGWIDVVSFVNYAHSLGQECWWTEMGFDSRGPSWQWAVPYGNKNSEQLQAEWLVRNYLMGIRAGIEQVMMFNGINEPGASNGGLYQNSGLLYGRGEPVPYSPKPAYHAVAALAKSLDGYTYIGDASPGGNVMLMRFKKGNQTIAYTWMRTVDGSTAKIKLDGKTITVTETPQVIVMKSGRIIREKKGPINKILFPKTSPRLKK